MVVLSILLNIVSIGWETIAATYLAITPDPRLTALATVVYSVDGFRHAFKDNELGYSITTVLLQYYCSIFAGDPVIYISKNTI